MKRMKKLMAFVLAVVMALSCTVLASATETDIDSNSAVTITSSSTNTPPTLNTTVNASGTNEGEATDVITARMPAVTADFFQMYLDPHNLVAQAQAGNGGKRFVNATNDNAVHSDTYVYFRTTDSTSGSGETYTNKSGELTIANKSSVDLVVDLEVKLNKNGQDVKLVDSLDALKEDGEWLKRPAMYVALTDNGTGDDAILAPLSDPGYGVPTFDKTAFSSSTTIPASVFYTNPVFEWDASASESLKKAFAGALKSDTNGVAEGGFLFTSTAADKISIEPSNFFSQDATTAGWTIVQAGPTTATNNNPVTDGTKMSYTWQIKGKESNQAKSVATITLFVDPDGVANAESTGVLLKIVKWGGGLSTKVSSTIEKDPAAYELVYNGTASGNKYTWTATNAVQDDALPKKTFQLTAGINPVDTWDGVSTSSNPLQFSVIWNIRGKNEEAPPVAEASTLVTAQNQTAVIKVYNLGKSNHVGPASPKGQAWKLWKVTYQDGSNTAEEVMGIASTDTLTTETPAVAPVPGATPAVTAVVGEYNLICTQKIFAAGKVNLVFLYEDLSTVTVSDVAIK